MRTCKCRLESYFEIIFFGFLIALDVLSLRTDRNSWGNLVDADALFSDCVFSKDR